MVQSVVEVLVVVRGTEVLVEQHAGSLRLCSSAAAQRFAEKPLYVGRNEQQIWHASRARDAIDLPPELLFTPARALFAEFPPATLQLRACATARAAV